MLRYVYIFKVFSYNSIQQHDFPFSFLMLGAVWTLWIRNCKHAKLKGNPDTLMPCISEKILRARSLGNSCLVS